jgi:hypothetical protein
MHHMMCKQLLIQIISEPLHDLSASLSDFGFFQPFRFSAFSAFYLLRLVKKYLSPLKLRKYKFSIKNPADLRQDNSANIWNTSYFEINKRKDLTSPSRVKACPACLHAGSSQPGRNGKV